MGSNMTDKEKELADKNAKEEQEQERMDAEVKKKAAETSATV